LNYKFWSEFGNLENTFSGPSPPVSGPKRLLTARASAGPAHACHVAGHALMIAHPMSWPPPPAATGRNRFHVRLRAYPPCVGWHERYSTILPPLLALSLPPLPLKQPTSSPPPSRPPHHHPSRGNDPPTSPLRVAPTSSPRCRPAPLCC
jgi:hypothetical protein